jgi:hypothetical protein
MADLSDNYILERGARIQDIDHTDLAGCEPCSPCGLTIYKDKDSGNYFVKCSGDFVEIETTDDYDSLPCTQDIHS